MLIKTTRFGEVELKNINNLRGGLNSKVEKIIKEIKGQTRISEVERAQLHVEIREQLISPKK